MAVRSLKNTMFFWKNSFSSKWWPENKPNCGVRSTKILQHTPNSWLKQAETGWNRLSVSHLRCWSHLQMECETLSASSNMGDLDHLWGWLLVTCSIKVWYLGALGMTVTLGPRLKWQMWVDCAPMTSPRIFWLSECGLMISGCASRWKNLACFIPTRNWISGIPVVSSSFLWLKCT